MLREELVDVLLDEEVVQDGCSGPGACKFVVPKGAVGGNVTGEQP